MVGSSGLSYSNDGGIRLLESNDIAGRIGDNFVGYSQGYLELVLDHPLGHVKTSLDGYLPLRLRSPR